MTMISPSVRYCGLQMPLLLQTKGKLNADWPLLYMKESQLRGQVASSDWISYRYVVPWSRK